MHASALAVILAAVITAFATIRAAHIMAERTSSDAEHVKTPRTDVTERSTSGAAIRPGETATIVTGTEPREVSSASIQLTQAAAHATGLPTLVGTTSRAEAGDRDAQAELAEMYYNGSGAARSYARALYWYRQAGAAGDPKAQTQLGWMYTRGIGISVDRREAAEWFGKAAASGNARAENYLGWAYVRGWGVPVNYETAREWLGKSAAADDRLGLYNLGVMHERGLGGPRDLQMAVALYKRSAAAGYDGARDALRRLGVQ
jgi:TPR repeat protein